MADSTEDIGTTTFDSVTLYLFKCYKQLPLSLNLASPLHLLQISQKVEKAWLQVQQYILTITNALQSYIVSLLFIARSIESSVNIMVLVIFMYENSNILSSKTNPQMINLLIIAYAPYLHSNLSCMCVCVCVCVCG